MSCVAAGWVGGNSPSYLYSTDGSSGTVNISNFSVRNVTRTPRHYDR